MSHTSQQFYFKVPPLSLPILHPPIPSLFPPSFHPQPLDIHSPLSSLFVIPLSLTFLPARLSVCLSVHLSGLSLLSRFALTFSPFSPALRPHAETGGPSRWCCGSCPLHVACGWTSEGSCRHLSLSPAFSLNAACKCRRHSCLVGLRRKE